MLKYFRKIKGQGGHTNEYYDYLFVRFKIKSFDDLIMVLQKLQIEYEILKTDFKTTKNINYSVLRITKDLELRQFAFVHLCNSIVKVEFDNSLISLSVHGKEGFQDGWGNLVKEDYNRASDIENLLITIDIEDRLIDE